VFSLKRGVSQLFHKARWIFCLGTCAFSYGQVEQIPGSFSDAIWEPVTQKIYVCEASSPDSPRGAVRILNPTNLFLSRPFFPGKNPSCLAANGKGKIYVACDGIASLIPWDLQTGIQEPPISWGENYRCRELGVVSAAQGIVALGLDIEGQALSERAVLFKDGQFLQDFVNLLSFTIDSSGQYLYSRKAEEGDNSLYQAEVTSTGLRITHAQQIGYDYSPQMEFADGKLFFGTGNILETTTFYNVGAFTYSIGQDGVCLPDPRSNLVHYLSHDDIQWTLRSFDRHTKALGARTAVGPLSSPPRKLFVWGDQELGFLTEANQLYLIETKRLPRVDLAIESSFSRTNLALGDAVGITITVKNLGSASAENVFVGNSVIGISAEQVTTTKGQLYPNLGVACMIGELQPNETVILTSTGKILGAGAVGSISGTTFDGWDDDVSNNRFQQMFSIPRPMSGSIDQFVLPAWDMVADPSTQTLYFSIGSDFGFWSNSLLAYHPDTGEFRTIKQFELTPSKLALSEDKRFIYAALGKQIARVDLNDTGSPLQWNTQFALPVGDIDILPGQPGTIIASSAAGSKIFDKAVARPGEGFQGIISIVDSTNAVQYDPETGRLSKLGLSQTGISTEDLQEQLLSPNDNILYSAGKIFAAHGLVLNAENGSLIRQLDAVGRDPLIMADPATRRFYNFSHDEVIWTLKVYDLDTLDLIGSLPVQGLDSNPSSLVKWGENLLAFKTANRLFLFRTDIYPVAELQLASPLSARTTRLAEAFEYTLSLTNKGPSSATNFSVLLQMDGPVKLKAAASDRGIVTITPTITQYSTGTTGTVINNPHPKQPLPPPPPVKIIESAPYRIRIDFSALAPGESDNVVLQVDPTSPGLAFFSGAIQRYGYEQTMSDDSVTNWITLKPPEAMVQSFSIAHNDIAYDQVTSKIYLSTRPALGDLGSSLASLSLDTFKLEAIQHFQTEPGFVILAPEGGSGVISLAGNNLFAPFTTSSGEVDQTIPSFGGVQDIQIAPVKSNRVVIAYSDRVQSYEGGNPSTNTIIPGAIAFSSSPDLLYHYTGQDGVFRRIRVDEGGLSLVDYASTSIRAATQILRVGERLLASTGELVDTTSFQTVGQLSGFGSGLVAYAAASHRIFSLNSIAGTDGTLPTARNELRIYDSDSYEQLGSIPLAETSPIFWSRMKAIDDNRVVISINRERLILINIPAPEAVDLALTTVFPETVIEKNSFTYQFRLSHNGPWRANNVKVRLSLPSGFRLDFLVPGAPFVALGNTNSSNHDVVLPIPELAPGATVIWNVTGAFLEPGEHAFHAAVEQRETDGFPANNTVGQTVNVLPLPLLSIDDVEAKEGSSTPGIALFQFALSHPSPVAASFGFNLEDGTAKAHERCFESNVFQGTITFQPGETTRQLVFSIIPNRLPQPNQTMILKLLNPTNLALIKQSSVLTVVDDDTSLLYVHPVTVGATATNQIAQIAIQLSQPLDVEASFSYATGNGSAVANTDYFSAAGTITFTPGEVLAYLPVTILPHPSLAAPINFTLALRDAVNVVIPEPFATISIEPTAPTELPRLLNVCFLDQQIQFNFQSKIGYYYQLLTSPTVFQPTWIPYDNPIRADGTIVSVTVPSDGSPARFFRIIQLSQEIRSFSIQPKP
jgi:hypothetical protein